MTRIQTRSSNTKATPSTTDLLDREIGYSFASGNLFIKNPINGAVEVIGGKTIADKANTPPPVTSVAGKTGAVTLTTSDISGYVAPPVTSVAGKTGVVTLTTSDISGYVAPPVTSVAGKTGAVTLTTSDISGYVAPTPPPVTSVAGKVGAVTLTTSDISGLGSAATQPSSAFATAAQGAKADSALQTARLGQASGVASLDSLGKLLVSQVPDLALVQFLGSVANQTAMLAIVGGQLGDWVIRTDLGTVWIITGSTPSQIGSWTQISYPVSPVVSVAGKTGVVTLTTSDISGYVAPPVTSVAGKTGAVTLTTSDISGLGTVATHQVTEFVKTINGGLPDADGNINVATATSPVTSVAGKVGAVTLTTSDISGYVAPPVTSVAGKTGVVTLTTSDISGYVAPPVTSVAGKVGAVTLTTSDISGLGSAATQPSSAFATAAQGTLASNAIPSSQKGVANGVASLDASGKVPSTQIPDAAIPQFLGYVANQTAMLTLVGQLGDWANRTDTNTTWFITGSTPSQIGSWTQVSYPTAPVTSVAGKTGAVTLTTSDISGYVAPPVTSVAGKTGVVTLASTDLSDSGATGRSVLQASNQAAAQTALGLGSAATQPSSAFATAAQGTLAATALQQSAADVRYIRTVNGVAPDASGNVVVSGGSGGAPADGGIF